MKSFVLDPTATPDAVSDIDIRLILEAEAGGKPYLSTSQTIMVGLALCKPSMLKNAGYPNPRDAWSRLDDSQRDAIADFRLFNLNMGESK